MSKGILSVVLVAATIAAAVFVPEALPFLIPGISALGVAAVTAGIEIGLSLLGGVLSAPKASQALPGNLHQIQVTPVQ